MPAANETIVQRGGESGVGCVPSIGRFHSRHSRNLQHLHRRDAATPQRRHLLLLEEDGAEAMDAPGPFRHSHP